MAALEVSIDFLGLPRCEALAKECPFDLLLRQLYDKVDEVFDGDLVGFATRW